VTTSPPHSTQLIGLALKKRFKTIRWVADLRDPWTDIYYYNQFKHTAIARKIDRNYERQVVENADLLISVSEDVKRIFADKSAHPIADKTVVIPNGFDSEDFRMNELPQEKKKVITYTGTISEAYDVDSLLAALLQLSGEWSEKLLIRFVGKVPSTIASRFRETGFEVELVGYVDHQKSIEYLFRSDLLLLVIPKVDNNKGILTGKFFEYLAAQKPVLAIGPVDGDLAQIIAETSCGEIFDYADSDGMKHFITQELTHEKAVPESRKANQYSRKELTRKLVANLEIHSR
jgi:glycosyltransferase involved in cell wall biosynthesis